MSSKKIQPRVRVKVSDLRRQLASAVDEKNRFQWDLSQVRSDLTKKKQEIESLEIRLKSETDFNHVLRGPIRRLSMFLDMQGIPQKEPALREQMSYRHGMAYATDEISDLYEVESRFMHWLTMRRP